MPAGLKIIVLDRDGVINQDSDEFIKSVAEWKPIPGSLEAIARLCQAGYRIFIASNQSGLGRALYDYDVFGAIHDRMQQALAELGGRIDGLEFAPEPPERATHKRKPNPGMLLDLGRRLGINLEQVCYVGDSLTDVEAARAAGCRPVLVRTGKWGRTGSVQAPQNVPIYEDLAAFAAAQIGEAPQRAQLA